MAKPRDRALTVTELADARSRPLMVATKAGPLRNGMNRRGQSRIWHIVPGATWEGRKALCGAWPSISWSTWGV